MPRAESNQALAPDPLTYKARKGIWMACNAPRFRSAFLVFVGLLQQSMKG
jgi:hypothetical protein